MFKKKKRTEAQVSVTDVMDAFYQNFATEETGRYWWWAREVLLEPDELIVDDNQHNLYRVPFTVGEDGANFGDPAEVRVEYVDAIARSEQVAAALDAIASVRGEQVAARFDKRPERPEQGGGSMDVTRLRSILKLSADVSDEEVLRIAAQRLSAQEEETGPPTEPEAPADEPETQQEEAPAEEEEEQEEAATTGAVTVDAAALAELRRQAADGAEARRVQLASEDDRILTQAVQDGKFPPARRKHWAKLLKADREGTIAQLDELADNVIPIAARGDGRDSTGEGQQGFGYPVDLFPEVAAKKAAMASGGRPRIATDRGGDSL